MSIIFHRRVAPIRREVFTRLYEQEFALPLEILSEIDKISDQEYDIRQDKKDDYREREQRRRTKPRRSRSAMSNSSNERVNRTPTPPEARQGDALAVEDISDISAERQRDNTSAGLERRAEDEHLDTDVEEAAAPIEANDDDIKMEALLETEQTPLLAVGNGDGTESTPQFVNEATDTAMALDPMIEEAVEAADADTDMATGLREGIVDA